MTANILNFSRTIAVNEPPENMLTFVDSLLLETDGMNQITTPWCTD